MAVSEPKEAMGVSALGVEEGPGGLCCGEPELERGGGARGCPHTGAAWPGGAAWGRTISAKVASPSPRVRVCTRTPARGGQHGVRCRSQTRRERSPRGRGGSGEGRWSHAGTVLRVQESGFCCTGALFIPRGEKSSELCGVGWSWRRCEHSCHWAGTLERVFSSCLRGHRSGGTLILM